MREGIPGFTGTIREESRSRYRGGCPSGQGRPLRFRLFPLLVCMVALLISNAPRLEEAHAAAAPYFDTVQKMYIGYYGRPADYEGMLYWAGRFERSKGNLGEIIGAFVNSGEFVSLYGNVDGNTVGVVVDRIYTTLFNRPVEEAARAYYVDGFNMGRFTPATLAADIMYGAQGQDALSIDNKVVAANTFTEAIRSLNAAYSGDGWTAVARRFLSQVTCDPSSLPSRDEAIRLIQANTAATSQTGQVTLAWDPNQEPDVAGYKIYVGNAPGDYHWCTDAGNVATTTLTALSVGVTYYFAVTAYDPWGVESDYSNEVVFQPW